MAKILGTSGNDLLHGTSDNDDIDGIEGRDMIYGYGGDDLLRASALYGGLGSTLYGGAGNDTLNGQNTQSFGDLLYGGTGNDLFIGNDGNDTMFGDDGNDIMHGDSTPSGSPYYPFLMGHDLIYGGAGSDAIYGGSFNDTLYGGDGDDTLYGGGSDDIFSVDGGRNVFADDHGNDTVDASMDSSSQTALYFGFGMGTIQSGIGYTNFAAYAGNAFEDLWMGSGNDRFTVSNTDYAPNDIWLRGFHVDGGAGIDKFVATDTLDYSELNGINDTASGTLTLPDGRVVEFGPGKALKYSNIISDKLYKKGLLNITSSTPLSGRAGAVSFDDFENLQFNIICFGAGTQILTQKGLINVETLAVGDMVLTQDAGYQPVSWVGGRVLAADDLAANPHLQPIRIKAGALGNGLPNADLIVSPQHRVLVRSTIAQRMFGEAEVLVAAKHLLGLEGVEIADDITEIGYHHFLFDRHHVVFSNGAPTESLYTGPEALKSVSPEVRAEILAIFPELEDKDYSAQPARMLIKGREGKNMVARMIKNDKMLLAA